MALLIPDAAGVYIDQKPPLIYNHQLEAWQDTEGYAHDNAFEAWRKIWPEKLYLYTDGDECVDVTGGYDGIYTRLSLRALTT